MSFKKLLHVEYVIKFVGVELVIIFLHIPSISMGSVVMSSFDDGDLCSLSFSLSPARGY